MKKIDNLPGEVWRTIDIEGMPVNHGYQVSNHGRIKSKNGILKGSRIQGYVSLNLRVGEKAVNFYVHKLVAKYFIDPPGIEDIFSIHFDGDKLNNHHSNIRWATDADFRAHVGMFGRKNKGNLKNAKLKPRQVKAIKLLLLDQSIRKKAIAKKFKVSHTQINRIAKGENWSNV